jgi:carbon storage regulator
VLVLSRRKDETIVIGDDVRVTIVDIRGDTVRLGITAPKSIPVYRQEIYEAIQRENIEAAQAKAEGLDALAAAFGAMGGAAPGEPEDGKKPSDEEEGEEKPKG